MENKNETKTKKYICPFYHYLNATGRLNINGYYFDMHDALG